MALSGALLGPASSYGKPAADLSGTPVLLGIAEQQGKVLLDDAGISVAAAVRDGKARPFAKASVNLSDGPDGEQGGAPWRHMSLL